MDIEEKQAEHIAHFVQQASLLKGPSLSKLIVDATSHPSLFAFSEILSLPNILQLQGLDNSAYLDLLRLFAQGTWSDYKRNADHLPQLVPEQVLKLKQLSMLTLAETNKVLPYDLLMQELDVTNVRELEDFLISECMYVGIVRGKLDQLRRCFEVQFAAGRDLRPEQLGSMIQTLSSWLTTSENLLTTIQEKIKWADNMSELDQKHKKEVEERIEEVKKSLPHKAELEFRGHEEFFSESGGVMDYDEDRTRPKSLGENITTTMMNTRSRNNAPEGTPSEMTQAISSVVEIPPHSTYASTQGGALVGATEAQPQGTNSPTLQGTNPQFQQLPAPVNPQPVGYEYSTIVTTKPPYEMPLYTEIGERIRAHEAEIQRLKRDLEVNLTPRPPLACRRRAPPPIIGLDGPIPRRVVAPRVDPSDLMPLGDPDDPTPPFTEEIINSHISRKFKMPTIKAYDGTGDTANHVRIFSNALLL
ncbi:hypothetical protein AgCh_000649 [Apium graveolens]